MVTIYIHTINGKPAFFSERNGQITYNSTWGMSPKPAYSLKQIRREQAITKQYRTKKGYYFNIHEYGYRRYKIDPLIN